MTAILRDSSTVTAAVSSVLADAESIDLTDSSSAIVIFPASPDVGTDVNFYVSADNVNFFLLVDSAGDAVLLTDPNASEAAAFPDDVFAAHYVKLVCTSSYAATDCTFMLKG